MRGLVPPRDARPPIGILAAVGLLAGATLGLQVGLTRHFSFLYWHHFAFMIIGIGMLGFGVAGALLARRGGIESGPAAHPFAARAAASSTIAVVSYLFVGPYLSFEPLQLLNKPGQFFVLLLLYLLILAPFTALGLAQGAILAGYRAWAHQVYAMDLLGAGLGCLGALGLLATLPAPTSLLVWAACAALAAGLLSLRSGVRARVATWSVCVVPLLLISLGWASERPFVPAPSKDMSRLYLDRAGQRREAPLIDRTLSSATIRLDVSPRRRLPFSFGGNVAVPPARRTVRTRTVFQDAAAPTVLVDVEPASVEYLAYTSQSIAYQIRERPRVCVIGAGGGPDVMIALHNGAEFVSAVEMNPQMLALGQEDFAHLINGLYQRQDVAPIVSEGRHFLARTRERFDIIQMSGVDTFAALASGAYAMSESYLYTVEAGLAVLRALEPDGLFTSSRWILDPPRESLRSVNVLAEALRLDGVTDPAAHLFVMQAYTWATMLVSRRPFTEAELATLRTWVAARGWTVLLDPNGSGATPFLKLVHAPAAKRVKYFASYPYNVSPVTDDDPFFFQFYQWRNLFEPPESRGGYLITRIPVGYAVLLASLLQMIFLSALCIFGPLWTQRSGLRNKRHRIRRLTFFATLGIGFMTIEITSIQMFTVFLGHPIYSMAITLTSLLVATGLGSAAAGSLSSQPRRIVHGAVIAITAWVLITAFLLPPLLGCAIAWPLLGRVLLVAGWLTPVGLALGMPFPTAIHSLRSDTPALVPWAWGTNACLSVIASLASVLLAMQVGFRSTQLIALALYWGGYLAWRGTVDVPPSDRFG
jgi:spermidine synthase